MLLPPWVAIFSIWVNWAVHIRVQLQTKTKINPSHQGKISNREDERKVKKNPCLSFSNCFPIRFSKKSVLNEKHFYFQNHRHIFLYIWKQWGGKKKKWPQGRMSKSIVSEKIQWIGKKLSILKASTNLAKLSISKEKSQFYFGNIYENKKYLIAFYFKPR